MPDNNPQERPAGGRDPRALSLEDMARILTASGPATVSVDMLRDDVAKGAPTNVDGTMNLVFYTAWLVKEMGRGRD